MILAGRQVSESCAAQPLPRINQLRLYLEKLAVEDVQCFCATFAMDEVARHCLLNGLDDIA